SRPVTSRSYRGTAFVTRDRIMQSASSRKCELGVMCGDKAKDDRRSRPRRQPPGPRGRRCGKSSAPGARRNPSRPAPGRSGRTLMPELPEVETIRRGLDREVVGKRVKTVQVTGTRTVRRQPKKLFISKLEGAKISSVDRRGKYLVFKLDTG